MPTNNRLQAVQTFNLSNIARLRNLCPVLKTLNGKFINFENISGNLGTTVTYNKPTRFVAGQGLVPHSFQPANQRVQALTTNCSQNIAYEFTDLERIYNDTKFDFARGAMSTMASEIERRVCLSIVSGMTADATSSAPNPLPDSLSGPFRSYGSYSGGVVNPLNTYGQLADMVAKFKDFGYAPPDLKLFIPVTKVPAIVNSGLNQFAPERSNKQAMSWEIGTFGTPPVDVYASNNLPIQVAGNVGNNGTTLTVVATNYSSTTGTISQITFSGATALDPLAIAYGDMFQLSSTSARFLQFEGNGISEQPIQFRATAAVEADGSGNVVVNIFPTLIVGQSNNDYIGINTNITAGMTATVAPSHRAGVLVSGDAWFLAMPKLPELDPYTTAIAQDEMTGASMRTMHGYLPDLGTTGFVHTCAYGSTLTPEYGIRVLFPVN